MPFIHNAVTQKKPEVVSLEKDPKERTTWAFMPSQCKRAIVWLLPVESSAPAVSQSGWMMPQVPLCCAKGQHQFMASCLGVPPFLTTQSATRILCCICTLSYLHWMHSSMLASSQGQPTLPLRWLKLRTTPDRVAELWSHKGLNSTVVLQHWTWISFNKNPVGKAAVGLHTALPFPVTKSCIYPWIHLVIHAT